MIKKESKNVARLRRHKRIRKNLSGTNNIPRLAVYKSNNAIYAQVINDLTGTTIVATSSLELKLKNGSNVDAAKAVGTNIAEKCKKAKISKVVFDRGGFLYHGRISALAQSAREAGLEF